MYDAYDSRQCVNSDRNVHISDLWTVDYANKTADEFSTSQQATGGTISPATAIIGERCPEDARALLALTVAAIAQPRAAASGAEKASGTSACRDGRRLKVLAVLSCQEQRRNGVVRLGAIRSAPAPSRLGGEKPRTE
jgi:hypothetical protein